MNKYCLDIQVTLRNAGSTLVYGNQSASFLTTDHLTVQDLTFFQICVILGGLQCLIDEAKSEDSTKVSG